MTETEYTKECLTLYSRMALAALATLIVTLGATLRLVIMKTETVMPGTMIKLITLGGGVTIVFFVLCIWFSLLTMRSLRQLKRSAEASHV